SRSNVEGRAQAAKVGTGCVTELTASASVATIAPRTFQPRELGGRSMAAFPLHEGETLVARALEQGEVCDLGAWPDSAVRGEALRRILLGLPVCLGGR